MFLLLLMLLCGFLLLYPIRLQADVLHAGETLVRLQLRGLFLRKTWRMKLTSARDGHRLTIAGASDKERALDPHQLQSGAAKHWAELFRASPAARRYLLRRLHINQLNALLRLHTENAAHTALITGFLRAVIPFLPETVRRIGRFTVIPDFHQGQTQLHARCILHFKLGTLLITAGLLLAQAAGAKAMKAREAA